MKTLITLLLLLTWLPGETYSKTDSITLKSYIIPTTLVATGVVMNSPHIKQKVMSITPRTHTRADDYIQYSPIVALYLLDLVGVESQSSTWGKTKRLGLSLASTGVIVHTLKNTTKILRPSGDSRTSFPSGHTALAFTGAGILFHEYKDTNKWIAYSGFIPATMIGILRQTNRKHWVSDTLVGAGVGILSSTLIYHIIPPKSKNTIIYPTMVSRDSFGVGVNITL